MSECIKLCTLNMCSSSCVNHISVKLRQHIEKQRYYFASKGPSSQGYGFFLWSCMDVRVGLGRRLSAEELMLLNCGVGEDS